MDEEDDRDAFSVSTRDFSIAGMMTAHGDKFDGFGGVEDVKWGWVIRFIYMWDTYMQLLSS